MKTVNIQLLLMLALASVSNYLSAQCESLANNIADGESISNTHRENRIEQIGMISSAINNDEYYYDQLGVPEFSNGFARAFWIGGIDPVGNLKISAKLYNAGEDYVPGPVLLPVGSVDTDVCAFFSRVWIITAADIYNFQDSFSAGTLNVADIPKDILEWPGIGNPHIDAIQINDRVAPFFDENQDGIYDPMDGDYPIALSETPEFIPYAFNFSVYNDISNHFASDGLPLGVEFQQINYIVNCASDDPAKHTVFTRVKIVYKGNEALSGCRIAIWEDADLGCYDQDFVGCDTLINANFVYNQDGVDDPNCNLTGITPVPNSNAVIRSTIFLNSELESFIYNSNAGIGNPPNQTTDANGPDEFYNYLNGLWRDGSPLTVGENGLNPNGSPTKYAFFDKPTDIDGWSMQTANLPIGDRRTVSTFYDGDLLPGQILTFDFADYVYYEKENIGLSIFDQWSDKISDIRQTYTNFGLEGNCNNGLIACEADCVRPGDTNNDQAVTGIDFIYAGAFAGKNFTGPERGIQSTQWFPFAASDFADGFDNLNAKYGDTNGDGMTTSADLLAVTENFGLKTPDSNFEDEPAGDIVDLNVHLEFFIAQQDIDYEADNLINRTVRFKLTIKNDNPDTNVPYHGISCDMKLDHKINGALSPLFLNADFDGRFSNLSIGGDSGSSILNENNTFSMAWTQTDGVDFETDKDLTLLGSFIISDDLTTPNQDGIESINIELFNLHAINANGEKLNIGYTQDSQVSVYNLPWDGSSSVDELENEADLLTISPNPAFEQVQMTSKLGTALDIQLMDINGRQLMQSTLFPDSDQILDIAHLNSGIYFIKALTANNQVMIKKFVKR